MKKVLLSVSFLVFCLALTSCHKKQKEADSSPLPIPIQRVNANIIIFPDGVLFDYDDILYTMDPESGMVAPVCNKMDCLHEPPSSKNPDPVCYAAYPGLSMNHVFFLGKDHIYTILGTGQNLTALFQSDLTGENRRKILEFGYELVSQGVYTSDGVYYDIACYREYESGEYGPRARSEEYYLIRVDMLNRTYEVIPSPFEKNSVPLAATNDKLYLTVSDPYEGEYDDQDYYLEWAKSIRAVCFDWEAKNYQTVFSNDLAVGGQFLYHAEEEPNGGWVLKRKEFQHPEEEAETVYFSMERFEYLPVGDRLIILNQRTEFQSHLVPAGDLGKKCLVYDDRTKQYGLISWEDYEKDMDHIQYIDLYPK